MKTIQIGPLTVTQGAALAPMAGVADSAFRQLCRSYGACMTVSEMVSSKGLVYGDKKTKALLSFTQLERPYGIQLFGNEPHSMAQAAHMLLEYQPDFIDINMGCPAPKIALNGNGSALMKTPALAGEIIRAVKQAAPLPVTVKFRKGWDESHVNAVEFAKVCEQNGADAVTVHGRTREQMYMPSADWEIIAQVKQAVRIPVIANGDIVDAVSAAQAYQKTGADLLAIGRGALGRPWVFQQITSYLIDGSILPDPSVSERMEVLLRHAHLACKDKGEGLAMKELRKHVGWYLKGLNGAARFRSAAGALCTLNDLEILIKNVLLCNPHESHPDPFMSS